MIVDDHSRAVPGYTVFLGDPTALQTALALRQAIWRKADPAWPVCGLPAALYSDHGSDFTSDHMAQVCADVKVQLIHSTPGKPRSRFLAIAVVLAEDVPSAITMGFGLDRLRGMLMKLRRMRQDLDHLNSWVLLLVTTATIVTGLVVHLWDLHGFTWHTYSGYALIVAVIIHLTLNLRQLLTYTGFRVRRGLRAVRGGPRPAPPRPVTPPAGVAATAKAVLLSRRALVGLALGGAGGYLIGQGLRPPPALERGTDLGLVYHRWSSQPGMIDAVGALANLGRQPPLYKSYDDAVRVALPPVSMAGGLPTETAIARRHSVRAYSADAMTGQELSRVLLLTAGLSSAGRRHHPSSGALYPIETYAVVHNVAGVEPGVYHYSAEHHALDQVRAGDFRGYVVEHGLNQQFLGECSVVVYLTMIFQRMRFKYGERSYRYGVIEAGHLGQNLYLAATSLGLGACAVGAYDDQGVNELLAIDGWEEVSVYLLSLGRV